MVEFHRPIGRVFQTSWFVGIQRQSIVHFTEDPAKCFASLENLFSFYGISTDIEKISAIKWTNRRTRWFISEHHWSQIENTHSNFSRFIANFLVYWTSSRNSIIRMLRFLGTYSRTMLSSYPSSSTLLRSIRPFSNQQKIAQSDPTDGKVGSRRFAHRSSLLWFSQKLVDLHLI